MGIMEKTVKETQVVYMECEGSYQKIPEYIQEMGMWVMDKGLEMTGMVYGTYYNSPDDVPEEELIYEIGFSVEGDIEVEGKVKVKTIPEHTVVAGLHEGPYTEVGPIIGAVANYAITNNYEIVGPITEIYLNDPGMVDESELLTEVQFPVVKK